MALVALFRRLPESQEMTFHGKCGKCRAMRYESETIRGPWRFVVPRNRKYCNSCFAWREIVPLPRNPEWSCK